MISRLVDGEADFEADAPFVSSRRGSNGRRLFP